MRRTILLLAVISMFSCSLPFLQTKKTVDLRLNLKKGDHYVASMNSNQTITQSLGGNDMTVTTTMGLVTDFDVTGVDQSGNYQVKETFKNINFEMGGPAPVKFNSEDTTQTDPMSSMLKNFVGAMFTMTLSPEGKIIELNGLKELMDKVMKSGPMADSTMDPQLLKMLQGFWSENGIRRMTEQGLGYIPAKPVKPGDSWKYELTANMMVPIKISNEYIMKEQRQNTIVIDSKSMMAIDTVMTVGEGQPVTMSIKMNGAGSGTIMVDRKSGMPDSSNIKIDLSGNMGLVGMPSGADMKIPISGVIISNGKYVKK